MNKIAALLEQLKHRQGSVDATTPHGFWQYDVLRDMIDHLESIEAGTFDSADYFVDKLYYEVHRKFKTHNAYLDYLTAHNLREQLVSREGYALVKIKLLELS